MRVLYAITSRNDRILHIGETFAGMGITAKWVNTDSFYTVCSYVDKKRNKLGFKDREREHFCKQVETIKQEIRTFHPDLVLFINFCLGEDSSKHLREIETLCPVAIWLVDSIAGDPVTAGTLPKKGVFVYEYDDIRFLYNNFAVEAEYCPVGYQLVYDRLGETKERDIDISFIGSPYRHRLKLLDQIATHGAQVGWNMKFYGPFYEKKYFWKEWSFRIKHPVLSKYIVNGNFSSDIVAKVYERSKICLNMHVSAGHNLNPRTFEILATQSFELLDHHDDYLGLLTPGKDIIDFDDIKDLLGKITYYLNHDEQREVIARTGYDRVKGKLSMESSLKRILDSCVG